MDNLNNTDYIINTIDDSTNIDTDDSTNSYTDDSTNIDTDIIKDRLIVTKSNKNLRMKINSDNHPIIFTKLRDLYNYIKFNSIQENDYFLFTILKNKSNVIIKMRSIKKILNYILIYNTLFTV